MVFIPTYICPVCGKVTKIKGIECPYCHKSFTKEEIDNMFFVCPTCLSDKIEIVLSDSNDNPNLGFTIAKARYSAIVDLAQTSVDSNIKTSYVCKNCATKFNSTNFYLISKLNSNLEQSENKTLHKKSYNYSKLAFVVFICLIVILLLFALI